MAIKKELLDELLEHVENPEDLFGKDGLLKELTARLVERVLEAELTDHLGYDKHHPERTRQRQQPQRTRQENPQGPWRST